MTRAMGGIALCVKRCQPWKGLPLSIHQKRTIIAASRQSWPLLPGAAERTILLLVQVAFMEVKVQEGDDWDGNYEQG